jgi:hypothetical protein
MKEPVDKAKKKKKNPARTKTKTDDFNNIMMRR